MKNHIAIKNFQVNTLSQIKNLFFLLMLLLGKAINCILNQANMFLYIIEFFIQHIK